MRLTTTQDNVVLSTFARCVLLGSLLVVSASCGETTTGDDASVDVSGDGLNVIDEMFVVMMLPHHEQAVVMSEMALSTSSGARAEVLDLARGIIAAQQAEIEVLRGFEGSISQSSSDHSHMMKGMLSDDELAALGDLRGEQFDRAWLEAMIAHHEGAIEMANDVLRDGSNSVILEMATNVVETQQAEIDAMKALLGK
jgi:uncharacterized protein (DUF305 family)